MADTSIIIESGFFDSINRDRLYSADDMNKPYKDLISEGVYGAIVGSTSTAFAVSPGTGLKVSVAAGKALLGGRWVELDDAEEFDVPSNSSGSSRTDSVILRVDVNNSVRASSLIYRTGTSEAPALVTTAGITEQRIANIIVANGASSISAGNITDERTFASLNVSTTQLAEVLYAIITEHPELITTIADGSITTAKLADGAVTLDKLAAAVITHFCLTNGYYINLTAGNAEQLISNVKETDIDPFIFRPSGGGLEIGDREEMEIQGISLPWNQLNPLYPSSASKTVNNVTVVDNRDGTYTISTTPEGASDVTYSDVISISVIENHKYYVCGTPSGGSTSTYYGYVTGGGIIETARDVGNGAIVKALASGFVSRYAYRVGAGTVIASPITFKPQIFDLTATFGTEIADYIYSLEQSTAGAGVAWFRRYFRKSFYPYCEPTMLHTKFSQFQTNGFNQWDEEWESGAISASTGGNSTNADYCRAKNFCRILPNTVYYRGVGSVSDFAIFFYDSDKSYIGVQYLSTAQPFTTPSNACYFRLHYRGTTYGHDICISIHYDNTRNDDYEPYEVHTYPLDSDVELMGVLGIDESGNLYSKCGDVYPPSGAGTRKMGVVDLGTLTWNLQSGFTDTFETETLVYIKNNTANISCPRYVRIDGGYLSDKQFLLGGQKLYFKDSAYTDAATFKSSLSGTYLVYEKAEYSDFTAEPFQSPMVVDNWGTELFTVPEQSGVQIPVGHSTEYPISIKDKVEASPNNPAADGNYLLHMESGVATYIPFINAFPTPPAEDGTYSLKVTVSGGTSTLSWVADA